MPFPTIPHQAYMVFQCMFAVITPALITGAFAERISFRGFLVFSLLWTTLINDPWRIGYGVSMAGFIGWVRSISRAPSFTFLLESRHWPPCW